MWRQLARRGTFALATVFLALSATFLLVTVAPNTAVDGEVAGAAFADPTMSVEEIRQLRQSVLAARNLDEPVHVRYARYMVDMATLRWGVSFTMDAPVTDLVFDRVTRTAAYAVPGFLLAVVLGVGGGVYSALRRGSAGERALRVGAYLAFGLPNFWLAAVAVGIVSLPAVSNGVGELFFVRRRVLPALLVATTLFAGQLAYARAESSEYVTAEFVRLLRAKGLSDAGVARHVLRNAAVPIATLFVTDLLAVLVVAIYVIEFFFSIPGLGTLTYHAAVERDMPLLLGTTVVVVLTGVVGNFCSDAAGLLFDPRVGDGE
jgi:peptide/nickel transport system permease protein